MELSELIQPKKNNTPLIQVDVDPDKYQKIATTLSEKRRVLEIKLKDPNSQTHEDDAIELLHLKDSMATFGISEIQYQAYLASLEKQSQTPDVEKITAASAIEVTGEDLFRD